MTFKPADGCSVDLAYSDNVTSREAAQSMKACVPDLRERVFAVVMARGPMGATCDEIEVATGLTHQTCSARVNELMRAKVFVAAMEGETPVRRRTRSGRAATVWVVGT